MSEIAVQYYNKKFGNSLEKGFIHLAKEMGELAMGIEKDNKELAKHEITELAALLHWFAKQVGFELNQNIQQVYEKKLESLRK